MLVSSARTGAALLVAAVGLIACSEDPIEDFTADNQTGFMAACSDAELDSTLIRDVCACVFDATLQRLDFTDFVTIDDELVESPEADLPDELTGIIADCVIDEADL